MYFLIKTPFQNQKLIVESSKELEELDKTILSLIEKRGTEIYQLIEKNDLIETNKGIFLVTSISEDYKAFTLNYEINDLKSFNIKSIYKKTENDYYKIWGKKEK